ncbi:MAG: GspE/PulE family protein [Patescibacteria group bacterium]
MAKKDEEKQKKTQVKIQQLKREAEENRAKNLAIELGFPYLDLRITPIDDDALALITKEESQKTQAAVIQKKQMTIFLAVRDPQSKETKSLIKKLEERGFKPRIFITSESNLEKAWQRYEFVKEKKEITKTTEIETGELVQIQKEIATIKDLEQKITEPNLTTTQLLNIIMGSALKLEASDVHTENEPEEKVRLRFRIDGILQDVGYVPFNTYQLFLSRIKILSGLKINIHNLPQDGRFSIELEGADIEIRTSIIPAEYGENIVLRILDPKTIGFKLEDLGIQDYDFKTIENELKKPNGMIVTTGPTGSGKTTLLYAFLKKVNTPELKIITLEDPIEYHLEGIEQTQVAADKGYTFANGLRSILRQDPDMILVGEIRDNETAETAIHAALTGHLVFSTIHTNDAAGAIPRLVDMKVNPNLIPPALNLVIAQRLVRRVCPKCSKEIKPNKETLDKIKNGLKNLPARLREPSLRGVAGGPSALLKNLDSGKITIKQASKDGCPYCNYTGYKGRIGVFELFIIDDPMEKTILKTPSIVEIKETAIKAGMVSMKQDGLMKVLSKITTMEEVERVLGA